MKPNLKTLFKIIQSPSGHYASSQTRLAHIETTLEEIIFQLREAQNVRFHKGNHYRKGNTRKEAWAEQWCCNLIDEFLGGVSEK